MTEGVRSAVEHYGYQIEEFGCVDGIGEFTGLYGRVKVKALPAPSTDWTLSLPPSISTNALEMLNPRPDPSWALVNEVSTWWKRSKILSFLLAGIPMPESMQ